jgi:hypothetical protein
LNVATESWAKANGLAYKGHRFPEIAKPNKDCKNCSEDNIKVLLRNCPYCKKTGDKLELLLNKSPILVTELKKYCKKSIYHILNEMNRKGFKFLKSSNHREGIYQETVGKESPDKG